jgi:hypothetical protein
MDHQSIEDIIPQQGYLVKSQFLVLAGVFFWFPNKARDTCIRFRTMLPWFRAQGGRKPQGLGLACRSDQAAWMGTEMPLLSSSI